MNTEKLTRGVDIPDFPVAVLEKIQRLAAGAGAASTAPKAVRWAAVQFANSVDDPGPRGEIKTDDST